jgi:hypothetical protein
MKKVFKRILFIGLTIFVLIQFYQPARNRDGGQVSDMHFIKIYNVPDSINNILKIACYDCHSNNTNYPWYAYIQPARWFMERHIKEGKANLNFSEFGNYSLRKQANKIDRMAKQIKNNEMPLASYTMIHRNAILSASQKATIINWVNNNIK